MRIRSNRFSLPIYIATLVHISTVLLLISSLFILTGCSKPPAKTPIDPYADESNYVYHRVKYQGETIAAISSWYTKSSKNWKEIANVNPNLVPSRMKIGDLVRIPKSLLKRPKSMPRDFVESFNGDNKKTSANASEANTSEIKSGNEWIDESQTAPSENLVNENTETSNFPVDSYSAETAVSEPPVTSETSTTDYAAPVIDKPVENDAVPESLTMPAQAQGPDENQKVRDQLMRELME